MSTEFIILLNAFAAVFNFGVYIAWRYKLNLYVGLISSAVVVFLIL